MMHTLQKIGAFSIAAENFARISAGLGFEFCKFASLRSMFAVSLSRTISLGQAFLLLKLLYWTPPQTRETLYQQKELEILY